MIADNDFDTFLHAYLVCALWSSTVCNEEGTDCRHLDDDYDTDDLAPEALKQATEECRNFVTTYYGLLREAVKQPGYTWSSAGHDYWLTRCGHGAGFWDRGLPGVLGDKLSDYCRIEGNRDIYPGDDGLLYFS